MIRYLIINGTRKNLSTLEEPLKQIDWDIVKWNIYKQAESSYSEAGEQVSGSREWSVQWYDEKVSLERVKDTSSKKRTNKSEYSKSK